MEHPTTIAVDLAESVFGIAVSKEPGRVCQSRRLTRKQMASFFANQPAATVLRARDRLGVLLRVTVRALHRLGILLAAAFFGTGLWLLMDWLHVQASGRALTYVVLGCVAAVLSTGSA